MTKVLDSSGLAVLWGRIKSVFLEKTGGNISGRLYTNNLTVNHDTHQKGTLRVGGRTVHYGTFRVGWYENEPDDAYVGEGLVKEDHDGAEYGKVNSYFHGTVDVDGDLKAQHLDVYHVANFYGAVNIHGNTLQLNRGDIVGVQSIRASGTIEGRYFQLSSGGDFITIKNDSIICSNSGLNYRGSLGSSSTPWERIICGGYIVSPCFFLSNGSTGGYYALSNKVYNSFSSVNQVTINTPIYWSSSSHTGEGGDYRPRINIIGSCRINSVQRDIDLVIDLTSISSNGHMVGTATSSGSFTPRIMIKNTDYGVSIILNNFGTATDISLHIKDALECYSGVEGIIKEGTWTISGVNTGSQITPDETTYFLVPYTNILSDSDIRSICTL